MTPSHIEKKTTAACQKISANVIAIFAFFYLLTCLSAIMADTKILLVGLGNPEPDYQGTRHNIGFFFLDRLAKARGWQGESLKMQGLLTQGRAWEHQILCLKPQTYMNRSGECVRRFVDFFKLPLDQLLVLHDDLDLPPGRIKVVARGGAGGHNGVRSLIAHLGTQDFARIKIGIGRPSGSGNGAVEHFVLAKMGNAEEQLFAELSDMVEEATQLFVEHGIAACMNRINCR